MKRQDKLQLIVHGQRDCYQEQNQETNTKKRNDRRKETKTKRGINYNSKPQVFHLFLKQ